MPVTLEWLFWQHKWVQINGSNSNEDHHYSNYNNTSDVSSKVDIWLKFLCNYFFRSVFQNHYVMYHIWHHKYYTTKVRTSSKEKIHLLQRQRWIQNLLVLMGLMSRFSIKHITLIGLNYWVCCFLTVMKLWFKL